MALDDYGALLASGQALVPDYATQQLQRQLAGAQIGQANAQTQQSLAMISQLQEKKQRQGQFGAAVGEFLKNPNADGAMRIATQFPEFGEEVRSSWNMRDKAERDLDLRQSGQVYSLALGGDYGAAADVMQRRIDADKAGGQDTASDEAITRMLRSNDPVAQKRALGMMQLQLSTIAGPEHMAALHSSLGKGQAPDIRNVQAGDSVISVDPSTGTSSLVYESPYLKGADGTLFVREGAQPKGGDPVSQGSGAIPFDRIIDVESNGKQFAPDGTPLTSPKGAVGIAQVMPATGPEAAKLAGLPWDVKRYRTDPGYNRAIGEAYYNEQRRTFGDDRLAAAAYNAGPRRVKQALSKGGPQGWLNHVPAETRDYVAKVSGGGAAMSQGGANVTAPPGYRVMVPGKAEKPAPARMTPQEVQAEGLDPNVVYYRGENGIPQAVSGQTKQTTQGRAIPDAVVKRLTPQIDARDALGRALSGFKDDFAGNAVTGDLENQLDSVFNSGTPGQRQWWADFKSTDNQIRNDLFGSALTATEKAAYEATTVSPRMSGPTIRANLAKRRQIVLGALGRQQRFLKKNGFNPEAVDEIFSSADAALGVPESGGLPQGARQIGTLKGRPVYQLPNGKRVVAK